MKFLVLALCVCAANAASTGAYKPWQQPQQVAKAFAQVVTSPVAAKSYSPYNKPVVVPIVPKPVQYEPVAKPVAKSVYNGNEAESAILRSESDVNADGFNFFYETANGIAAQSSGVLKRVDDSDVIAIQGSYQYVGTDGVPVQVTYVADENGFQPKSDILPVGPAIPEAIARSLEYIRTHPSKSDQY